MNNLYHRVAVASVGIALGFAPGANKEARAATFTLPSTDSFYYLNIDEEGDSEAANFLDYGERYVGKRYEEDPYDIYKTRGEYRSFYGFNLANLSLNSNTVISSAIFQTRIDDVKYAGHYSKLQASGYTATSAFSGVFHGDGEYLDEKYLLYILERKQKIATFNVLTFINQIKNDDTFWLGIRRGKSGYGNDEAFITLPWDSHLTITIEGGVEPEPPPGSTTIPEPTTIFGSAIGLGLGGWLKRRKSALQNKTAPQR